MAAKLKTDGDYSVAHTVRWGDFSKLVSRCENPPRASQALKDYLGSAPPFVKKS